MKILTITFLIGILVLNIVNARLGLQEPAGMLITIILILVLHGMSRRASGDVVLRLRSSIGSEPSRNSPGLVLTRDLSRSTNLIRSCAIVAALAGAIMMYGLSGR